MQANEIESVCGYTKEAVLQMTTKELDAVVASLPGDRRAQRACRTGFNAWRNANAKELYAAHNAKIQANVMKMFKYEVNCMLIIRMLVH